MNAMEVRARGPLAVASMARQGAMAPAAAVDAYAGTALCHWPNGKLGNTLSHGIHVAHGALHVHEFLHDLTHSENRLYTPDQPTTRPLGGTLRVATWNLHQGMSPDPTGAKPQLKDILAELKDADADVYLMQEVAPWHVGKIVDAVGMDGYYVATTPKQGNLILVHPEISVKDNAKQLLNDFQCAPGDSKHARRILRDLVLHGGTHEPRAAQALQVELPDGRPMSLWNVHVMSQNHYPGEQQLEAQRLLGFIDASSACMVVGGGDMNATNGSDVLNVMKSGGLDMQGARIDFIGGRNLPAGHTITRKDERFDKNGLQISDHPLVIAEVPLATAYSSQASLVP